MKILHKTFHTRERKRSLHLVEYLFDFRTIGEILVEIEKVLKLQLLYGNGVRLSDWQARHFERFLDTSLVVFVRCKLFDDARGERRKRNEQH